MSNHGVIQIKGGLRGGGGGGGGGGGPPPPPPHHGGPRMPQMQQQQQMQHHPMMTPQQMNQQLHPDVITGRLQPHLDLRNENITEDQIRESLSHYFVVRIEKADEETYDEYGQLVGPTWQNCIRREIYEMSNKQVAARVRELDLRTKSVGDKKSSLIPAQQRQLEIIRNEYMATESDPLYHIVLVQLEHQLKEVREHRVCYDRKKGKTTVVTKRGRHGKPKYRRQSITAYFKRMPRDGENLEFLRRKQMEMRWQRDHPPPPRPMMPQQPVAQIVQPKNQGAIQGIKEKKGKKAGSSRGSQSGWSSSSGESWAESDSEFTNPSSVSSDRRKNRGRSRSRSHSRHRLRPEHFGHEPLRRHSRGVEYPIVVQQQQPQLMPAVPVEEAAAAFERGVEFAERHMADARPRIMVPHREFAHRGGDDILLDRRMARLGMNDDDSVTEDFAYEPEVFMPPRRPIYQHVHPERMHRQRARQAQREMDEFDHYPPNPFVGRAYRP